MTALKHLTKLLSARDRNDNFIYPWPAKFLIRYSKTDLRDLRTESCVKCGLVATIKLVWPKHGSHHLCLSCTQKVMP